MSTGPAKIQETIQFGEDFKFDWQTYRLTRDGRVLKLERIPREILLFLIEQKGLLVTREQIAEKIWGKDVFLDTDNSINGAIRKIRQILKDDPEQPRFIQTITGKGYRFIAPVAAGEGQGEADAPTLPPKAETPAPVQSKWHPRSKASFIFVAGLTVLLLAALGLYLGGRFRTRPQPSGERLMLAVLPFQNLTGDAGQEYFTDGMTEEMISHLGNLDPQHMGVIARTSVMHYKNSSTPLDQIARELGVQFVIEGSIRRDADKVRITVQLIQMRDQTHIWARQYDRELHDLLAVQGEIAQETADEIQLTLGDHKPAAVPAAATLPRSYDAYDLYLKGQYFLNKRTAADLEEAIGYFQQATAKDPNYARAYAGLADSYALIGGYSQQHIQTERMAKARAAALRALQIDGSLAEAHTALALIVQNYDWDWQTAEKEFRRAIDLNPNYATAHHWYAEHLMWRGRFDEALQESERARQLDPLSLIIAADNGAILYFSRQYDRAIEKWRWVLEMDPDFLRGHLIVGAYTEKGMFAEALAENEKFRPMIPISSYWSWRATIYGRSGQTEKARQSLHQLLQSNQSHSVDPMIVAWAYLGTGDKDQAFGWFEKAYLQHSNELVSIKVSPACDPLRSDPRFQNLLRRIGLAQ